MKQKMGKVKLRVRETALRLREFTVDQMVKATGFNQESVQSELRRMREKGLLTVGGRTSSPGQRGAPPCIYRLTDDPEVRLGLASDIEEFFSNPHQQDTPSSQHYFDAVQLLDEAEGKENDEVKNHLLQKAEEELDFTWYEEGEPKGAVAAYLKCQSGRLEYLKGNYDRAEELLKASKQSFATLGLNEPNGCAEYLPALLVRRQWEQQRDAPGSDSKSALVTKTKAAVRRLQESGPKYLSNHPMSAIFLELSEQLLDALEETMRNLVLAEARAASQPVFAFSMCEHEHRMHAGVHAQQKDFIPRRSSLADLGYAEPPPMAAKSQWTHNLADEYQYTSSDGLEYLALNTRMPRADNLRSKTIVENSNWFDLK